MEGRVKVTTNAELLRGAEGVAPSGDELKLIAAATGAKDVTATHVVAADARSTIVLTSSSSALADPAEAASAAGVLERSIAVVITGA
jgi:hypothetical protein